MRLINFLGFSARAYLAVAVCCFGLTGCKSEQPEISPSQYHTLIVKPTKVVEEKDPLSQLDGQLLTGSPYAHFSDPNQQDTTPAPSYSVDLPK